MISVVIPLYNKELSIAATLRSVFAQTYTDFEVVVVNDGSTDESLEVVKSFSDSRIRILTQANAGVSAARNMGILEAKGDYVAFLDADDIWTPDYLETLAALIRDYPIAGLYSLGYKEISSEIIESPGEKQTYRGRVLNPWTSKYTIWTGGSSSSRERLIKLGMFDTRMTHGEDLDMWWRLILDGGLVVDTKCCAYYRQDTENRAMNKNIPLEKHIPYYEEKFTDARANNIDFRRFFDKEMIYRLYPYLFDKSYCEEAKRIARKFDYSLQKKSMYFRMQFPHIYRLYQKMHRKW